MASQPGPALSWKTEERGAPQQRQANIKNQQSFHSQNLNYLSLSVDVTISFLSNLILRFRTFLLACLAFTFNGALRLESVHERTDS